MAHPVEYLKRLKEKLRRLLSGNPPPEDPYSYVGALRKPRRPTLSAAAVADRPEE